MIGCKSMLFNFSSAVELRHIYACALYQRRQSIAMETASSISVYQASSRSFVIPRQTLIVLCGPAGSGKSTFAHRFVERHYAQGCRATTIVSSDYCRALICDDVTNQQMNRDTF